LSNTLFIKKIKTLKELKVSVEILAKGFLWSNDYSELLINSLIKNRNKIDFYGFTLNENDNIIGVILTLCQGFVKISDREILVINLSSWFVSEEHRGYKSIYMLKKITNELSDFIITNFSPNNSARAILKALGYKSMKRSTKNYYSYKFVSDILHKIIFRKNLISKNENSKYPKSQSTNYRDSKFLDLNINGISITLLINDSHISKKIRFLKILDIKIPRLHVLWCSDNNFLKDNFQLICSFLFYEYKTYILSIHCLETSFMPSKKSWRDHFYKSPKNVKIQPFLAGSEYSIKF
tara:strand:- start:69 stop:950 length:882 start_codon:yes stop_codon:yes gene_type:complete